MQEQRLGSGRGDHVAVGAPADAQPDPVEHGPGRGHRLPEDAGPRGRRGRRHGQLGAARLHRDDAGRDALRRRRARRRADGRRRRLRRHRRVPVQRAGASSSPAPRSTSTAAPTRRCSSRPEVRRIGRQRRVASERDAASVLAASRARRVSTLARCVRYSTLALRSACGSASAAACSAASSTDAPPASADATLVARIGVEPMLTRPTPASPLRRQAATPTIAQSWARRLNFWKLQPAPLHLRARGSR